MKTRYKLLFALLVLTVLCTSAASAGFFDFLSGEQVRRVAQIDGESMDEESPGFFSRLLRRDSTGAVGRESASPVAGKERLDTDAMITDGYIDIGEVKTLVDYTYSHIQTMTLEQALGVIQIQGILIQQITLEQAFGSDEGIEIEPEESSQQCYVACLGSCMGDFVPTYEDPDELHDYYTGCQDSCEDSCYP